MLSNGGEGELALKQVKERKSWLF